MKIKEPNAFRFPYQAAFNQERFLRKRQRMSGCGPTTAACLSYYLRRTPGQSKPSPQESLDLMEKMWERMPPTLLGLFNPYRFKHAFLKHTREEGLSLRAKVIPIIVRKRPQYVIQAIRESLSQNIPVPFLHLIGQTSSFDTWHWITLIGLEDGPHPRKAEFYDNGRIVEADLVEWMTKPFALGAFICFTKK